MEFNFEDRLVFNAKENQKKTKQLIGRLHDIVQDSRLNGLLTEEDLRELQQNMDALAQHAESKLKIVVAGSFKRGKSSLINAILGEQVVPTDVSPETITINYVDYREQEGIEAVLTNGMRLSLNDEEITRERLEKVIEEVPEPIDHVEIFRNLPILQEISFIDTPGLEDVDANYQESVTKAMLQSDIIIYLVSAMSPLSAQEQTFLNAVAYPEGFSKMFVVINMADTLDSCEDADRVHEHVAKMIYEANPNATVCILSSLDEYCRKKDLKRPNHNMEQYLEDHFQAFSNALTEDVLLQKELIKASRMTTMEQRVISLVKNKIEKILLMLEMDSEKLNDAESSLFEEKINLDKTLEKTKKTVTDFVGEKKNQAHVWVGEYMDRMKAELVRMKDSAKGQDVQKHLSFYISDKTKQAFQACLDVHAGQLNEMLEKQMKETNGQVFGQEENDFRGAFVRLTDISWTKIDAVVYFGDYIASSLGVGLGTLAGLLVDAGTGAMRQKKIAESQKDILNPVLENFSSITGQVFTKLDETYDAYAKHCLESIEEYYRNSIEEALETVRQARGKSEEFNEKKDTIRENMNAILNSLRQLETSV